MQGVDPALRLALLAALTAALLTSAAVAWAACSAASVTARLGLLPGRAGAGALALLAAGLLALSHGLDQTLSLLGLRETSQLIEYDVAVASAPQAAWPWLLLGLAAAPGIGEEIFFRGLVQRGLVPRLGRSGAVVAASAVFGALHGDPVHAGGAFVLGLYLGAVAEISGSTRAAIACHVINNLAAVGGIALPEERAMPSWLVAAAGIGAAALALDAGRRLLGRSP